MYKIKEKQAAKLKIKLKTLLLNIQSNIQDGDLCKTSQRPTTVNYFRKKLYLRRLTKFKIRI